jgi:hypothetical protein
MVGRRQAAYHMMGAADAALAAAAATGDPRAQAICDAMKASGCGNPDWRQRQIAPGVQAPCDDLVPLPLTSNTGTNTFVNAGPTTISMTGRVQKPFRGERPVAIVTRNGASATPIVPVIRGGIRIGIDPQVAQVADMPVEFLTANAFGVRYQMVPCEPGVDVTVDIALVGPALAVGDTLTVFLAIWGSFFQ